MQLKKEGFQGRIFAKISRGGTSYAGVFQLTFVQLGSLVNPLREAEFGLFQS